MNDFRSSRRSIIDDQPCELFLAQFSLLSKMQGILFALG